MHSSFGKKIFFSTLLCGIFLGSLLLGGYAGQEQGALSGGVLRLHIVGSTNTEADQTLKLLVRDSILNEHGHLFAHAQNAHDAAIRAQLATAAMADTAEKILRKNGCPAPVSAKVEQTSFPTKSYGKVRLPAGSYTAVNIRIGSATGKNWWCVLYPPLCLTEGSVKADEKTLAILRKELSPSEYALVTQPEKISFHLKFRLLELFGKIFS